MITISDVWKALYVIDYRVTDCNFNIVLDYVSSHWAHFTVCRFICVYLCVFCVFLFHTA